jgi:tRNA A37 methylthiotransferase MiaB
MINDIPGDFKLFFISPHPKPSTRAKLSAGLVPHRNEVSGAGNFFDEVCLPRSLPSSATLRSARVFDELIETLAKCEKFGKLLNLPVQSGDNEILKKMNRNYTIEEYKKLVKKIRKKIPNIKLSTDVIVGFPGETEKQFQNTVKLFKELKFNWAYVSKYSPRPGTPAFQMKDNVPLKEKKRREEILRKIINGKK